MLVLLRCIYEKIGLYIDWLEVATSGRGRLQNILSHHVLQLYAYSQRVAARISIGSLLNTDHNGFSPLAAKDIVHSYLLIFSGSTRVWKHYILYETTQTGRCDFISRTITNL